MRKFRLEAAKASTGLVIDLSGLEAHTAGLEGGRAHLNFEKKILHVLGAFGLPTAEQHSEASCSAFIEAGVGLPQAHEERTGRGGGGDDADESAWFESDLHGLRQAMHTLLGTNVKYIFAGTEGEGIDLIPIRVVLNLIQPCVLAQGWVVGAGVDLLWLL